MRKKSCSSFWKIYRVVTGVLLALIAVFFVAFYDYMGAYERSQPMFAVEQYLESVTEDDLLSLYSEYAKTLATTLETPENVAKSYCDAVNQLVGQLDILPDYSASGEDGTKEYIVQKGETPIISCTVDVSAIGKYGFNECRIRTVSVIAEHLPVQSSDYTIIVPAGSEVTVNGYVLSDLFFSESNGIYGYPHALEKQISTACDTYSVADLLATPIVRCVWNGMECTGELVDGTWYFSYPESVKKTYTICAPDDALVTVNGMALGEEYVTETNRPYTYSIFDSADAALPGETVYSISGMLHEPEVKAVLQGVSLNVARNDESYSCAYPDELLYRQIICVPQGSVVHVNGHLLGDEYKMEGTQAYPELFGDASRSVLMDRYVISRLFAVNDQVEAVLGESKLTLCTAEEGRVVTCRALYPTSANEDVHALATSFCKDYFAYTAGGYRNTEENLNRVLSYMPKNSELYLRIERSKVGIEFVTPVSKQIFRSLNVETAEQLNDSTIVCSITYDIEQWTYQVMRTYSGKLWLAFEKSGDNWYITHMLTDIK